MAFDGNFTLALSTELAEALEGGKVEKIHHSGNACIEMAVYSGGRTRILVLSALPSMPYVTITERMGEHPQNPTMLCLLFRKHLSSAKILSVRALENERAIRFEFEGFNELGHPQKKLIYIELMGKYSNIILCDGENRILGALHTSDITASARRLMVGFPYEYPPRQDKISALELDKDTFLALCSKNGDKKAEKFLLETFLAFSPLVCREIVFSACGDVDAIVNTIDPEKLAFEFLKVINILKSRNFSPTVVFKNDKAFEFSFINIRQYGNGYSTRLLPTLCETLDCYYESKKSSSLISERANELLKVINSKITHLDKKIASQQSDLDRCEEREKYKKSGDLITANIYRIKQGDSKALCFDYETDTELEIALDVKLSPAKNAQRYYKQYTKYKNASVALNEQLALNYAEKQYLESVFDSLARAETEHDTDEIRSELENGGYIKIKGKKQKSRPLPTLSFTSTDGLCIRVGRNNVQNDTLTKSADKNDIWFHVKNAPGSHTVLFTEGNEPTDRDYTEAATLAAVHSSLCGGKNVEVDYTRVRNVKKPAGAKPGFVTYDRYFTAVVDATKK